MHASSLHRERLLIVALKRDGRLFVPGHQTMVLLSTKASPDTSHS
jgi:hypothetical protein